LTAALFSGPQADMDPAAPTTIRDWRTSATEHSDIRRGLPYLSFIHSTEREIMSKLVIHNEAQPERTQQIDGKVTFMLGSMMHNVPRVEISFSGRGKTNEGNYSAYVCTLVIIENSGLRHELHNEQPDPNNALEGALARGRRSMTRTRRARNTGWRQASARQ